MINKKSQGNDFFIVEIDDDVKSTISVPENILHKFINSLEEYPKKKKKEKNKKGSLCELFLSEYFSIELLMIYLTEKDDQGIIDFLCNLLFQPSFNRKTFFYLPQLCSLIRSKLYHEPILNYIIWKSSEDPLFAVTSSWIIDSYITDLNNNSKKFDKIMQEIENKLINGPKIKDVTTLKNNQKFIEKKSKLQHFDNSKELYAKLKKMCEKLKFINPDGITTVNNQDKKPSSVSGGNTNNIHLKKTIKEIRKELLYKTLSNINKSIDKMLKENQHFPSPYVGYIVPFPGYENKVIVNFISEYCFCFSTKARVPVKLTIECVDIKENKPILEPITKENNQIYLQTNNSDDYNHQEQDVNKEENQERAKKIIEDIKYENEHPNELDNKPMHTYNHSETNRTSTIENIIDLSSLKNPFKERWINKENEIKARSRFRNYDSLTIISFIAKANDDLRQEHMTMQLIKKFDEIFKRAGLPLKLHPYEIVITSASSGLIEFLPDTLSIDSIKQYLKPYKIPFYQFFKEFFKTDYVSAQKNFVESLAAYSIISYLIAIKDRHNGNILLDRNGSIIHIDFGFVLGISPGGNLNFENAPFKLTKDYIRIMDGVNSEIFAYYKSLVIRGILEARKHIEILVNVVEAMGKGVPMPCFNSGIDLDIVLENFKERFLLKYTEDKAIIIIENLIDKAVSSWRTTQYDIFQKLTNGILP